MGCAPCLPKKEPKGGKSGNPQRPHFLTVAVGSAAGLRARGGGGGGERRIVVEVVEGGGTAPTKLEAEAVGGSGAAPAWEKVFEAIPLRGGGKAAARFTVFEGADFLGFASLPLSERAQMQLLARPAEHWLPLSARPNNAADQAFAREQDNQLGYLFVTVRTALGDSQATKQVLPTLANLFGWPSGVDGAAETPFATLEVHVAGAQNLAHPSSGGAAHVEWTLDDGSSGPSEPKTTLPAFGADPVWPAAAGLSWEIPGEAQWKQPGAGPWTLAAVVRETGDGRELGRFSFDVTLPDVRKCLAKPAKRVACLEPPLDDDPAPTPPRSDPREQEAPGGRTGADLAKEGGWELAPRGAKKRPGAPLLYFAVRSAAAKKADKRPAALPPDTPPQLATPASGPSEREDAAHPASVQEHASRVASQCSSGQAPTTVHPGGSESLGNPASGGSERGRTDSLASYRTQGAATDGGGAPAMSREELVARLAAVFAALTAAGVAAPRRTPAAIVEAAAGYEHVLHHRLCRRYPERAADFEFLLDYWAQAHPRIDHSAAAAAAGTNPLDRLAGARLDDDPSLPTEERLRRAMLREKHRLDFFDVPDPDAGRPAADGKYAVLFPDCDQRDSEPDASAPPSRVAVSLPRRRYYPDVGGGRDAEFLSPMDDPANVVLAAAAHAGQYPEGVITHSRHVAPPRPSVLRQADGNLHQQQQQPSQWKTLPPPPPGFGEDEPPSSAPRAQLQQQQQQQQSPPPAAVALSTLLPVREMPRLPSLGRVGTLQQQLSPRAGGGADASRIAALERQLAEVKGLVYGLNGPRFHGEVDSIFSQQKQHQQPAAPLREWQQPTPPVAGGGFPQAYPSSQPGTPGSRPKRDRMLLETAIAARRPDSGGNYNNSLGYAAGDPVSARDMHAWLLTPPKGGNRPYGSMPMPTDPGRLSPTRRAPAGAFFASPKSPPVSPTARPSGWRPVSPAKPSSLRRPWRPSGKARAARGERK